MLKAIIDMLKTDDFIDAHEVIQIAKGKYKVPTSAKEILDNVRRRNNG